MKILIVFRGGYTRVSNPQSVCNNIKNYIINPLINKNHLVNTVFYTYNTDPNKLNIYKENLKPIKIAFTNDGQVVNFKELLTDLKSGIFLNYDMIVILRFELIYMLNIIEWNILNKEGIILPFKEDKIETYQKERLYSDTIIIISSNYFLKVVNAILEHEFIHNANKPGVLPSLHELGILFHDKFPEIPFSCIVNGYYHSLSPALPVVLQNPIYIQVHNILYNEHTYKHLISENSTQQLSSYISNNIPCIFAKYGDGEYNAANYYNGGNCDGTPYTRRLGDKVRESFIYNSSQKNSMIGVWHDLQNKVFWEGLGNSNVNWVDYHTVLIDNNKPANHNNDRLELFKSIKQSKRKKIYISNAHMYKSKDIFLIDSHVIIDPSNWFETQYEQIFNQVKSQIEDDNNTIILTSAGIGAKYLISELHKLFPKAIYIDIGSGFDKICTKNDTRSYNPSYTELCDYLRPILPEGWN